MKQSRIATVTGIIASVVGTIQAVDLVPLFGSTSHKIGAALAVIGAIVAGLGRALNDPPAGSGDG